MPEFTEKEYRSIINKKKHIDSWFWDRYSINPYNGCLFGCVYCDARSDHYQMPEQFENDILIKKDPGKALDKHLRKTRSFIPDVVGIGGVTDSYQPAEKRYRNTRQILEVLTKYRYPVHIATKSTLILEDIGLLERIAQQNWCTVSITITTTDTTVAKFLDFRAPSPQKRLEVVQTIKTHAPQVQCGVLLIPLAPFLADQPDQVEHLFQAAKSAGADYLLFGGGMTMRNKQALWFLNRLKEQYPELLSAYEELYQFQYHPEKYEGQYTPAANYKLEKNRFLLKLSKKYELPYRIKRFVPKDFRHYNYRLSERLFAKAYEEQMTGQAWDDLFWAAQAIQNLKEDILTLSRMKLLDTIPQIKGRSKIMTEEFLNQKPF